MIEHPSLTIPAIAALKTWCPSDEDLFVSLVHQALHEKGISEHAAQTFASLPAPLLQGWLHHLNGWGTMQQATMLKQQLAVVASASQASLPSTYEGNRVQNRLIDVAIAESPEHQQEGMRPSIWRGAASAYWRGGLNVCGTPLASTPLLILGAGAAGILLAHALLTLGFMNVEILDKEGSYGGIWKREGLRGATRANPFPLVLEYEHVLPAAPGAGSEVLAFLGGLTGPFPALHHGTCHGIIPGDLAHRVYYRNARGEQHEVVAPIVINAIGVGEPLPPHRPGKMHTDVTPELAGRRWQHTLTEAEVRRWHGKELVFVGLSNATFAMLAQIQRWNRQGAHIGYRVLTHYPDTSLLNPTQRVEHNGTSYHFYRSLERMHLLRVAGDLPEVDQAFREARDGRHILSHVTAWQRGNQTLQATCEDGSQQEIACDELYTLIGYGPQASLLEEMGLAVNNHYLGAVDMDYDGEAHRPGANSPYGRERVSPGYFCFGIRNSFNPNEVLLNGLLFRLPQLVAGIVLRATEVAARQQGGRA